MIPTNSTHEISADLGVLGKRKSQPTSQRPGRRFYFSVRSHAPVWRVFRASIVRGEGVILITGEPGVGKSHFLNRLKDVLPDNRDMVHIPDPTLPANLFLQKLMEAVKYGNNRSTELPVPLELTHKQLLDVLEERAATGRRLLVAIDQAQMLSDENATILSYLIPFSAKDIKPVQVLLVGRPELLGCLDTQPFATIRKEIIGSGEITPFTRSEVLDFIHFYIRKSVGRHIRVSWFAWVDIFSVTQGNPFRIEQILNQTLAQIKLRPRWIITRSLVKSAQQKGRDLPGASKLASSSSIFNLKTVAVALMVLLGVGIVVGGLFDSDDQHQTVAKIALPIVADNVDTTPNEEKPLSFGEVMAKKEWMSAEPVQARAVLPPNPAPELEKPLNTVENKVEKSLVAIWPSPPTTAPQRAQQRRFSESANPQPILTAKSRATSYTAPVSAPKQIAAIVKRSPSDLPGTPPRKVGFFSALSRVKPKQVSHNTTPDLPPLRVGSVEDRVLEKMVAKVQKLETTEILSDLGLADGEPLPLTTEETLKSAGQIFVVQIGSFLNRDNAERLMLDLSNRGLEPYVHLFEKGEKKWFSVRLNYRDRAVANKMADDISKRESIPARVIDLFYE
ncbi:MAG: AAA family ATPase [Magnetococcales bacterium]|nr:AAA family ATPase [Magnetococcales bacterium]